MNHLFSSSLLAVSLALGITSNAVADDGKIKAIVESANAAWNKALNSGDTKALSALYAEDATLSPGNGKTLKGRTEIESLFKGFVANGVHNHTLEIIEVGGNGKLIYQVSKWNAEGAIADGKKPSFGGITTSVLELNANGQWLARSHVWNAAN